MDPEKNDVDISKLFEWSKPYTIKTNKGKNVKVYVRLIGDADINRARVFSLRKSAELREKLRTVGTDERLAFIASPDSHNHEKIVEVCSILNMREITQDAIRDVRLPLPVEPHSDSSTERKEKYQKEIDDYPKKREILVNEYVKNALDKKRESFSKLTDEQLAIEYESSMIAELCEQEILRMFREYCIYSGTYKDSKFTKKFFSSFEEFDNLPPTTKDEFISFYTMLELDVSQLKK
jgi:hypothetical protein